MPRKRRRKEQSVMTPFGPSVPWNTPATATPVADIRAVWDTMRPHKMPMDRITTTPEGAAYLFEKYGIIPVED